MGGCTVALLLCSLNFARAQLIDSTHVRYLPELNSQQQFAPNYFLSQQNAAPSRPVLALPDGTVVSADSPGVQRPKNTLPPGQDFTSLAYAQQRRQQELKSVYHQSLPKVNQRAAPIVTEANGMLRGLPTQVDNGETPPAARIISAENSDGSRTHFLLVPDSSAPGGLQAVPIAAPADAATTTTTPSTPQPVDQKPVYSAQIAPHASAPPTTAEPDRLRVQDLLEGNIDLSRLQNLRLIDLPESSRSSSPSTTTATSTTTSTSTSSSTTTTTATTTESTTSTTTTALPTTQSISTISLQELLAALGQQNGNTVSLDLSKLKNVQLINIPSIERHEDTTTVGTTTSSTTTEATTTQKLIVFGKSGSRRKENEKKRVSEEKKDDDEEEEEENEEETGGKKQELVKMNVPKERSEEDENSREGNGDSEDKEKKVEDITMKKSATDSQEEEETSTDKTSKRTKGVSVTSKKKTKKGRLEERDEEKEADVEEVEDRTAGRAVEKKKQVHPSAVVEEKEKETPKNADSESVESEKQTAEKKKWNSMKSSEMSNMGDFLVATASPLPKMEKTMSTTLHSTRGASSSTRSGTTRPPKPATKTSKATSRSTTTATSSTTKAEELAQEILDDEAAEEILTTTYSTTAVQDEIRDEEFEISAVRTEKPGDSVEAEAMDFLKRSSAPKRRLTRLLDSDDLTTTTTPNPLDENILIDNELPALVDPATDVLDRQVHALVNRVDEETSTQAATTQQPPKWRLIPDIEDIQKAFYPPAMEAAAAELDAILSGSPIVVRTPSPTGVALQNINDRPSLEAPAVSVPPSVRPPPPPTPPSDRRPARREGRPGPLRIPHVDPSQQILPARSNLPILITPPLTANVRPGALPSAEDGRNTTTTDDEMGAFRTLAASHPKPLLEAGRAQPGASRQLDVHAIVQNPVKNSTRGLTQPPTVPPAVQLSEEQRNARAVSSKTVLLPPLAPISTAQKRVLAHLGAEERALLRFLNRNPIDIFAPTIPKRSLKNTTPPPPPPLDVDTLSSLSTTSSLSASPSSSTTASTTSSPSTAPLPGGESRLTNTNLKRAAGKETVKTRHFGRFAPLTDMKVRKLRRTKTVRSGRRLTRKDRRKGGMGKREGMKGMKGRMNGPREMTMGGPKGNMIDRRSEMNGQKEGVEEKRRMNGERKAVNGQKEGQKRGMNGKQKEKMDGEEDPQKEGAGAQNAVTDDQKDGMTGQRRRMKGQRRGMIGGRRGMMDKRRRMIERMNGRMGADGGMKNRRVQRLINRINAMVAKEEAALSSSRAPAPVQKQQHVAGRRPRHLNAFGETTTVAPLATEVAAVVVAPAGATQEVQSDGHQQTAQYPLRVKVTRKPLTVNGQESVNKDEMMGPKPRLPDGVMAVSRAITPLPLEVPTSHSSPSPGAQMIDLLQSAIGTVLNTNQMLESGPEKPSRSRDGRPKIRQQERIDSIPDANIHWTTVEAKPVKVQLDVQQMLPATGRPRAKKQTYEVGISKLSIRRKGEGRRPRQLGVSLQKEAPLQLEMEELTRNVLRLEKTELRAETEANTIHVFTPLTAPENEIIHVDMKDPVDN